jgi:hypothetical protein
MTNKKISDKGTKDTKGTKGTKEGKEGKRGKEAKESAIIEELSPDQRAILANKIRMQLCTIEADGLVLESMEGIKKLMIMLSLFEKAGKEFETYIPLKELGERYIEVRLRTNKNKPSVVVIKQGTIPQI